MVQRKALKRNQGEFFSQKKKFYKYILYTRMSLKKGRDYIHPFLYCKETDEVIDKMTLQSDFDRCTAALSERVG